MKTVENTPDPQHYEQDSNQVKISRHYSIRPKTAYPPNCIYRFIQTFYQVNMLLKSKRIFLVLANTKLSM